MIEYRHYFLTWAPWIFTPEDIVEFLNVMGVDQWQVVHMHFTATRVDIYASRPKLPEVAG